MAAAKLPTAQRRRDLGTPPSATAIASDEDPGQREKRIQTNTARGRRAAAENRDAVISHWRTAEPHFGRGDRNTDKCNFVQRNRTISVVKVPDARMRDLM